MASDRFYKLSSLIQARPGIDLQAIMSALEISRATARRDIEALRGFLECEHLTALDGRAVDEPALRAQRCAMDESAQLIADKGDQHKRRYLAEMHERGLKVLDIAELGGEIDERVTASRPY